MRFQLSGLAFAVALALAACSSSTTVPDAGTDAGTADDGGDAGPGDAGFYCPGGYTFIPFLTATATTHTYSKPDQVLDPQKQYAAVLETDVGRLVWSLNSTVAPIATNSLVFLALHHYFDGIAFHRVIDNFVAQGGDPNTLTTNRGSWGKGTPGYAFKNEVDPSVNFTDAGIVAMANAGVDDTNGSQFFITFTALPKLDQKYTIFGNVIEGSDVLPLIARGTDAGEEAPPATPTRILEMNICDK